MEYNNEALIQTYSLGAALKNPSNVGILELTGSKITELPPKFVEMVNLHQLVLRGHVIADLAALLEVLGKLPNLRYLGLDLGDCDLLPAAIGRLTQMEHLNLTGKNLHALPEEIKGMAKLRQIELEIDNWIGEESHLQALGGVPTFQFLGLRGSGNPARGLDHLKQVTGMSAYGQTRLPFGLGGMQALERLSLGIVTSEAPQAIRLDELNQLQHLRSIWILSKAPLKFPPSMAGMLALESFEIEDSQIQSLPDGLADAPAIKVIKATKNSIEALPDWIGELKTLEELDLTENKIKALPATLSKAVSLKKLLLEDNKLEDFPNVILACPALEMVSLSSNKIAKMPEGQVPSKSLQFISLRMNKLADCPWPLVEQPGLGLYFEGNPFVDAAGYGLGDLLLTLSREPYSAARRRVMFALVLGDMQQVMQLATLEDLLLALNHSSYKLRALAMNALHQFLPDPFSVEGPPASIHFLGSFDSHPLPEYMQKLKDHQIPVTDGKPGPGEVVVIDERPGDEVMAFVTAGAKLTTVAHLVAFLDQLEKPWLRKQAEASQNLSENLFQLLASDNPDNITMAFQMMMKGGVPNDLASALLVLQLIHPDPKLRKQAEKLLTPVTPPALKSFLQANKRNVTAMSKEKLIGHMESISQHPEVDPYVFGRMAYLLNKDLGPIFTPYVKPSDLEAFLNKAGFVDLPGTQLKAMPQGLLDAEQVDSLSLASKYLTQVPVGIGKIKGLRRLELNHNTIQTLPEEFNLLQDLEWLDLRSNGMKQVPSQILTLPKLAHLNMSGNRISELPEGFSSLTALTELLLNFHQLPEFPGELAHMKWLECLHLTAKDESLAWKTFPSALLSFPNVSQLDLGNHLMGFPPEAIEYWPLRRLGLSNNRLTKIPQWFMSRQLLEVLDVSRNPDLGELPETIGELMFLEVLNLAFTGIKVLPESLAGLKYLQELDISGLQLRDKEAVIAILKQLPDLRKITYQVRPDEAFKDALRRELPGVKIY